MTALDLKQLMTMYTQVCRCRECHLPAGYCPQLRPPGPNYRPGGVVFLQINPGHIGSMTDQEIARRYRTAHAQAVAKEKAAVTGHLLGLQTSFLASPTATAYDRMRDAFLNAMSRVWGWPPGKYGKTVEAHGVALHSVAMANLAQCPVPDDAYGKAQLDRCWSKWTAPLLALLAPSVVVAQGKQVFDFLSAHRMPLGIRVAEGLHHADRRSADIKARVLGGVRDAIRREA